MRDVSELKDQSQSLCVESDVFEKVGNTKPTDISPQYPPPKHNGTFSSR